MAAKTYQLKITLLGSKPPIWRRLLVPSDMTLLELHEALQVAMGWQNCHMHSFRIGRAEYPPSDEFMGEIDKSPELRAVLKKVGSKAIYTYDFGDGWGHLITVEKILATAPDVLHPICLGGKLRCPPEDCGGLYGYYNLLEALSDPKHPEHRELKRWLGKGCDPQHFSVDEVNAELAAMYRR